MREDVHLASLCRNGLLRTFEDEDEPGGGCDPEGNLAASAASGQAPPAGPQWVSRLPFGPPIALRHIRSPPPGECSVAPTPPSAQTAPPVVPTRCPAAARVRAMLAASLTSLSSFIRPWQVGQASTFWVSKRFLSPC